MLSPSTWISTTRTGRGILDLSSLLCKPLLRLCSESVHIHNNQCEVPMNRKTEWHQPVVASLVVTRELEELEVQSTRRRAGSGTGEDDMTPILESFVYDMKVLKY